LADQIYRKGCGPKIFYHDICGGIWGAFSTGGEDFRDNRPTHQETVYFCLKCLLIGQNSEISLSGSNVAPAVFTNTVKKISSFDTLCEGTRFHSFFYNPMTLNSYQISLGTVFPKADHIAIPIRYSKNKILREAFFRAFGQSQSRIPSPACDGRDRANFPFSLGL
jgi:hypothetical protein